MIRESSDSAVTSNDDELSDQREETIETFKKMAFSVNKVDNRLMNLYTIKKADEYGINFGFDNDHLVNKKNKAEARLRLMRQNGLIRPTNIFESLLVRNTKTNDQPSLITSSLDVDSSLSKSSLSSNSNANQNFI